MDEAGDAGVLSVLMDIWQSYLLLDPSCVAGPQHRAALENLVSQWTAAVTLFPIDDSSIAGLVRTATSAAALACRLLPAQGPLMQRMLQPVRIRTQIHTHYNPQQ